MLLILVMWLSHSSATLNQPNLVSGGSQTSASPSVSSSSLTFLYKYLRSERTLCRTLTTHHHGFSFVIAIPSFATQTQMGQNHLLRLRSCHE